MLRRKIVQQLLLASSHPPAQTLVGTSTLNAGMICMGLCRMIESNTSGVPVRETEKIAKRTFSTSRETLLPVHVEEEVYNRQRQMINLGQRVVKVSPDAWIAPSAVLVGDVDVYEQASVWHNCVLRGDLNSIRIGAFSNVKDRTVIHAAKTSPTGLPAGSVIGQRVSIGMGCLLRSVNIQDDCVIGDRSILLEGSMMEKNAVLLPGSVVPPGRRVPGGEVWGGSPARFVRKVSKDEKVEIPTIAEGVLPVMDEYRSEFLEDSFAYVEVEELRGKLNPECELVKGAELQRISDEALGAPPQ